MNLMSEHVVFIVTSNLVTGGGYNVSEFSRSTKNPHRALMFTFDPLLRHFQKP